MARDLNAGDENDLKQLLEMAEGQSSAVKTKKQTAQPAPAAAAPAAGAAAAPVQKKEEKKAEKKPLKVSDDQLREGMRVICGITWALAQLFTWIFSKEKKLEELTEEERAAWVEQSLGFARMIPAITVVAAVLGFPSYMVKLVASKLVARKPKPSNVVQMPTQQKAGG